MPNFLPADSWSQSLNHHLHRFWFITNCRFTHTNYLNFFPYKLSTIIIRDCHVTRMAHAWANIIFCISNSISVTHHQQNAPKNLWDYNKGNYLVINNELCFFLDIFLPDYLEHSVETNLCLFWNKASELIHLQIPVRRVYSNSQAPWYNRYLHQHSSRKKGALESWSIHLNWPIWPHTRQIFWHIREH